MYNEEHIGAWPITGVAYNRRGLYGGEVPLMLESSNCSAKWVNLAKDFVFLTYKQNT